MFQPENSNQNVKQKRSRCDVSTLSDLSKCAACLKTTWKSAILLVPRLIHPEAVTQPVTCQWSRSNDTKLGL